MIFVSSQLMKKLRKQHGGLHFTFRLLEISFVTVDRKTHWMIITRFGCSSRMLPNIVKQHEDNVAGSKT